MKKLLLIFLLLPFFSCTKKNEKQYVLQNNEDGPMESSVIQSEELSKITSTTEPFIEYTIPGVNISFKYPNNERIKVSVNSSLNYSTHSPRILKGVISMFQGSSLFQSSAV